MCARAGAYRPTEDVSGSQRALLRRLGDAALGPFGAASSAAGRPHAGADPDLHAFHGRDAAERTAPGGPGEAPQGAAATASAAGAGAAAESRAGAVAGACASPGNGPGYIGDEFMGPAGPETAAAAAAAARVAAAVLDAEPRALGARIDALWALLWAAAADGGACAP